VIDILGKLDFDFVFIDGEHGPFGLDQLEDLCRTAEHHNLTPMARAPAVGSSTILRYLDRGIILGPDWAKRFSQSLGYPGQPDHPEVVKTMQEVTGHIRQAGRRMQGNVMQGAWVSDMLLDAGHRILSS